MLLSACWIRLLMVSSAQPGNHVLLDEHPGAADLDGRQALAPDHGADHVGVALEDGGGLVEGERARHAKVSKGLRTPAPPTTCV